MSLFEKREIPNVYQKIVYADNSKTLFEADAEEKHRQENYHVYTVAFIPEYLNTFPKKENQYIQKTYYQNNLGYAISIKNIINIDDYLKTQFKSNSKDIKRGLLRLESCFNIRYQFYFGSISKKDYEFLMSTLREMIIRRFSQRKDDNIKLKEWNLILEKTFEQILKKEASLFVIYDDDKPIDISLNYHYHNIIFSAISSYNIDYYKFGVGHIEIIKLLEWCLKEHYEYLELGYGDLDFKRRWCNHIYKFKYQVIFNQNALLIPILAKFYLYKLSLKEYLKEKGIDLLFKRVKERITSSYPKAIAYETDLKYDKIIIKEIDNLGDIVKVDLEDENNQFLKKILYEFLYSTAEHKDKTAIYKISQTPNSYVIKGINTLQQIIPAEN